MENACQYNVKLDIFEGPMDLLLYLVEKNDIDIYDINISEITREFLEYVEIMKFINLDSIGEFLIMAARLMEIKARTLLPKTEEKREDGPDPREELARQLVEYSKCKEAAKLLKAYEEKQKDIFYRDAPLFDFDEYIIEASLYDLIEAFRQVIARAEPAIKELIFEEIPIETKIREILSLLQNRDYIEFEELFPTTFNKYIFIVTFLAVLELIRSRQISARQKEPFGKIRLFRITTQENNA
jgi:segregation and condensation protein A